jgi:hypothetical protein
MLIPSAPRIPLPETPDQIPNQFQTRQAIANLYRLDTEEAVRDTVHGDVTKPRVLRNFYTHNTLRELTPQLFADIVNAYFETVQAIERKPTMAGLVLALGFESVKEFKKYEEDDRSIYATLARTARTRMEEYKNEALLTPGTPTSGYALDLKNQHGWADKVEQQTIVETGDRLSLLVQQLQGSVLRPKIVYDTDSDSPIIDAESVIIEEDDEYPLI